MNFNFMPSLEHMALVRTAIMLWNHEDNRVLLMRELTTSLQKRQRVWLDVEDNIIAKVPKLLLPKSLENKLIDIIKPVGVELLQWSVYHESFFYIERNIVRESLNKLCWTVQGTVDRKKTAEILINEENFKISSRYRLACVYCLEYEIQKIWNEMSEPTQSFFYDEDPGKIRDHDLVVFWTYSMKGEIAKVKDMVVKRALPIYHMFRDPIYQNYPFNRFLLETSSFSSKSATEYFFKKLTCREKEEFLVSIASKVARKYRHTKYLDLPYQCNDEIIYYLLSQMNNELLANAFKCDEVLKCLLDWPMQSFFKEAANRMPESSMVSNDVLTRMADKVVNGYRDFNYQKLFREIWQQNRKNDELSVKSAIGKFTYQPLLLKLLMVDDKDNVELILNDATPSQREDTIFSIKGMEVCERLISSDKSESLKFFIQKSIPCKKQIVKLKGVFKSYITMHLTEKKPKEKREMQNNFSKLVDHLAQEINKKVSREEDDCSRAKKLCSKEMRK